MEETKKRLRASVNAVLARQGLYAEREFETLLDAILEAVAIEIVRRQAITLDIPARLG